MMFCSRENLNITKLCVGFLTEQMLPTRWKFLIHVVKIDAEPDKI